MVINLDRVDLIYAREPDAGRVTEDVLEAEEEANDASRSTCCFLRPGSPSRWRASGSTSVPEHRSPRGSSPTRSSKRPTVVGMTTFPNTVLLRGPSTILVDPGLHLQNEPVVRALARRGLGRPTSTSSP